MKFLPFNIILGLPSEFSKLLRIGEIKSRNTAGRQFFASHILGVVGVSLIRRNHIIQARHIWLLIFICNKTIFYELFFYGSQARVKN